MSTDEADSIRADIAQLRAEVKATQDAIEGLVEAWRTASGVVKFVKWAAALATAISTIYVSAAVGKDIAINSLREILKP